MSNDTLPLVSINTSSSLEQAVKLIIVPAVRMLMSIVLTRFFIVVIIVFIFIVSIISLLAYAAFPIGGKSPNVLPTLQNYEVLRLVPNNHQNFAPTCCDTRGYLVTTSGSL
jgi:uncharacterized SAM-binding protein YcdF (DUF218 family)